jgi:hypothetical protein
MPGSVKILATVSGVIDRRELPLSWAADGSGQVTIYAHTAADARAIEAAARDLAQRLEGADGARVALVKAA